MLTDTDPFPIFVFVFDFATRQESLRKAQTSSLFRPEAHNLDQFRILRIFDKNR